MQILVYTLDKHNFSELEITKSMKKKNHPNRIYGCTPILYLIFVHVRNRVKRNIVRVTVIHNMYQSARNSINKLRLVFFVPFFRALVLLRI